MKYNMYDHPSRLQTLFMWFIYNVKKPSIDARDSWCFLNMQMSRHAAERINSAKIPVCFVFNPVMQNLWIFFRRQIIWTWNLSIENIYKILKIWNAEIVCQYELYVASAWHVLWELNTRNPLSTFICQFAVISAWTWYVLKTLYGSAGNINLKVEFFCQSKAN